MIAWAIVLGILLLIAMLRFGVDAVYGADGLTATAVIGPFRVRLYPKKAETDEDRVKSELRKARKKAKDEKKAAKKAAKKAGKKAGKKEINEGEKKKSLMKPGMLSNLLDMLPAVGKLLDRFRRRLLIKRLIIDFTAGGSDPSNTALMYGASFTGFWGLTPWLERHFRIRKRELHSNVDFEAVKPVIYVNAAVSIAVWEVFYIIFAMVPAIIRFLVKVNAPVDRKERS